MGSPSFLLALVTGVTLIPFSVGLFGPSAIVLDHPVSQTPRLTRLAQQPPEPPVHPIPGGSRFPCPPSTLKLT